LVSTKAIDKLRLDQGSFDVGAALWTCRSLTIVIQVRFYLSIADG
jgi:hypothetical protein